MSPISSSALNAFARSRARLLAVAERQAGGPSVTRLARDAVDLAAARAEAGAAARLVRTEDAMLGALLDVLA